MFGMGTIPKGYYLKARVTQDSAIGKCPPHIREVWDWLLLTASHQDTKYSDRGQVICDYKRIQEELAWYVGWRKNTYTHSQIAQAMKTIRQLSMITTQKTTAKTIVTIVNYSRYQDPKNYTNAIRNATTNAISKPIRTTTLYNNEEEKRKKTKGIVFENKELKDTFSEFETMRNKIKKPMTEKAKQLIIKKLNTLYPNQINMQIKCLNQSIENCWQTLYPVKLEQNVGIRPKPAEPTAEISDEVRSLGREKIEKIRKDMAERFYAKTKIPPKNPT